MLSHGGTADTSQRGRVAVDVATTDLGLYCVVLDLILVSVDAVSTRFARFLSTFLTSGCSIALSVPVSAVGKRPNAPDRLRTRYCAKARRARRLGSCVGQWSLTVGRRSASNVLFSSLICFEVQLDIFFFEPLARYGGCRIIQVQ